MALLTATEYTDRPIVAGDQRDAYGLDPSQFGDLYLPTDSGPHRPIILIHGGCWRAQYGLEPLGGMARALARRGVAVWNIEYRRLGNGGGWPATFADVTAALDHLAVLAPKHQLDLSRITAVGHSAGGHLALWLAVRAHLPRRHQFRHAPSRHAEMLVPHAVVSLAGIPNLPVAVARDICRGAVTELLGGDPVSRPRRYAVASPHGFAPLGVPHLHIIGDADSVIPPDYIQDYVNLSRAAGDISEIEIPAQAGHFEIVMPESSVWPGVADQIISIATDRRGSA